MNTILLYWNQSNINEVRDIFHTSIREIDEVNSNHNNYYSELWYDDYKLFIDSSQKVEAGDRFFIYCYGGANNGICASGFLASDYYEEFDPMEAGRLIGHFDLVPDYLISPEHYPILCATMLTEVLPDFERIDKAYGIFLDEYQTEKLETLWRDFLDNNKDIFLHWSAKQNFDFTKFIPQKEEYVFIGLTDEGKFRAHNYRCDLDIECDDIETVKKDSILFLKRKYGESKKIKFEYTYYFSNDSDFVKSVLTLISNSCKDVKDGTGKPIIKQIIEASLIDSLEETRLIAMFLKLIELELIKETDLQEGGIPNDIIETVHILIKSSSETYESYIDKVAQNLQARNYMIDALRHKLNIVYRYTELKDEDFDNIRKWLKAYHKLMDIRLSEIRNESEMHNFWQNK